MRMLRQHLRILTLSISLLLGACGGSVLLLASGGIGGTGISIGPILAFGSIWVNGVEYDTSNAKIYVEGVQKTIGDTNINDFLSEGQVVRVEGTNNGDGTGTANIVYFNNNIEGPVQSVTPIDASTIGSATVAEVTTMGQTVIIDERTILNGTTLSDMDSGIGDMVIEVSGLLDANKVLHATYVKKTSDTFAFNSTNVELKGEIETVNSSTSTFTVNGLTVYYAGGADISDLEPTGPQVGMYVEIKGTYSGTQLDATKIEFDTDFSSNEDDSMELENLVMSVTSFTAPKTAVFHLGYQEVRTSDATVFKGGLPEDIVTGVRLEAEGIIKNGVLIADEIQFEDEVEIESTVNSASYDAPTNILTLTLHGMTSISIIINSLTDIDDGGADTLASLTTILTDGATPDHVKIRGRLNASNDVIATEIKAENSSSNSDAKLQGPVTAFSASPLFTVEIISETIDVSGFSDSQFEGVDDSSSSRNEFFTNLKLGNIVGIEGEVSAGVVTWDSIELENDE